MPSPTTIGTIQMRCDELPLARNAVSTAAPARFDGIERSIPPVSMHSVWPKPTNPMNDAVISTVRTWS